MKIKVDFWNVGQGDASTLEIIDDTNKKHFIVIDVGPKLNSFVQWVCRQPRSIYVDFLFITHNDMDHIGGLDQLTMSNRFFVNKVYYLIDRPKKELQHLFKRLDNISQKHGRFEIDDSPRVIYTCDPFSLVIRHPDLVSNRDHIQNATSGILSLMFRDKNIITWPGDQRLSIVSQKAGNTVMLFGPHHGAPQDNYKVYGKNLDILTPSYCYASLATDNRYSHPKEKYIQGLAHRNCLVRCSQFTYKCGISSSAKLPPPNTSAFYALPVQNGFPCYGHYRFYVDPFTGEVIEDPIVSQQHKKWISQFPNRLCK